MPYQQVPILSIVNSKRIRDYLLSLQSLLVNLQKYQKKRDKMRNEKIRSINVFQLLLLRISKDVSINYSNAFVIRYGPPKRKIVTQTWIKCKFFECRQIVAVNKNQFTLFLFVFFFFLKKHNANTRQTESGELILRNKKKTKKKLRGNLSKFQLP